VRNLWLLLLYASDLFGSVTLTRPVAVEDNPDDIPDLVAEILCHEVAERLRRNLTRSYQPRHAVVSRVRGHIDLLATERRRLLDQGKVACRFEELTVDSPRNRYVRAALEVLGALATAEPAHRCRALAGALASLGVGGAGGAVWARPGRGALATLSLGRNDAADRLMLAAADLAFSLALPTEEAGPHHLRGPRRDEGWVRKLFERAVAGFYRVALAPAGWTVRAGHVLHWPAGAATPGMAAILPLMRTDIELEHPARGRLVIDTKFTSALTAGWYHETLKSGYLYQLYAYLRSQEDAADPPSLRAAGLLLHPTVGPELSEAAAIQGHEVRVATVDLAAPARAIRARLLDVVSSPLEG